MTRTGHIAGGLALLLALSAPAWAQPLTDRSDRAGRPPGADQPAEPETNNQPAQDDEEPSIRSSLPPQLADPGGVRASLERAGITYALDYTGEVLGNARGGIRRKAVYEGLLDFQFDADLEKLLGLRGLTFHTNFLQIHGRGLSGCCLENLFTVSSIEALPETRLFELWFEQTLGDDKVAVRAGQLAADSEFFVSEYGGLFVNASFGWPVITAANLPNGGPAYPTATPGVRVKVAPNERFSVMAALFNGDPVGPGGDKEPQYRDRSGFEFRTTDPPLFIAEAAYAYNGGEGATGLPGTVKLGGYQHFGRFDDQRFGVDGRSLADPLSSGTARRFRGNSGVYAVLDQLVYRTPGTEDGGLALFARVSGSPADRNLISFYADGGLTYKGLIPGRPDDTFGVGFGYAQVSSRARGFDRDATRFGPVEALGEFDPATGTFPDAVTAPRGLVRSSEALFEVTYQAQVVPGFTIQPDFQYIVRPGANVANPRDPNGGPVRNAAVFGLRAAIRY